MSVCGHYRHRVGDRPTIYDVAREAGVAASTVSRAYSRPGRVNAETARAIFAAAERIGYRVSKITGSVGRQTSAVALMVSDITNPFYGEITKGAEQAARHAGYALLLSDTSESGQVERDIVERTLDLVEGVVLGSSRMSDSSIRMIAKQKPLVLLNRQITETSCIVADNPRGVRRAVEHLGTLGHTTITYVAGPAARAPDRPERRPHHAHRLHHSTSDRRGRLHRGTRLQRRTWRSASSRASNGSACTCPAT
jgi:DNA-binding LacI/PurR family transcriptional regulator